ncbi:MAG: ATP-binding protein [Brevundimonas sp.]
MSVPAEATLVETDEDLGSRGTRWMRFLVRYIGPDAGVFERQLPFVCVYTLALLVVAVVPSVVTSGEWVSLGAAVAISVPLLGALVPWHRQRPTAQFVLPILQLVAVALLRTGTGGNSSMFGSMLFLPVVTLAGRPSRAGVVIGTVGVGAAVVVPVLLDVNVAITPSALLRSLFVAVVALTIGVIVHEATSRLRARNAALAGMQVEQMRLNARLQEDTIQLARLARANDSVRTQLVSVMDAVTEQAIIATDAEGTIELFNPGAEHLFGYGRDDAVGQLNLVALHERDELERRYVEIFGVDEATAREADDESLFAAVAAPTMFDGVLVLDWAFRRRDSSRGTMQLTITRRTDPDGSTVGYVMVATDVTAEREAARLKDQFVSLVSHELRTPLASVLSYTGLILDGPDPLTEEQHEFLVVIERNARRQLRLVSDLLLTAQLDAGTFSIRRGDVDLSDVARATVAAAAPGAEAARVVLAVQAGDVHVPGDAMRLEQVLANLVSNAVKFTPPGGTVDVRVEATPDGGATVEVADTGIGIPPDELDLLATRFFRASTATKLAIPGVGLGLLIAKAVVEAHGGTMSIVSRLGHGTTFTVELPGPSTPS